MHWTSRQGAEFWSGALTHLLAVFGSQWSDTHSDRLFWVFHPIWPHHPQSRCVRIGVHSNDGHLWAQLHEGKWARSKHSVVTEATSVPNCPCRRPFSIPRGTDIKVAYWVLCLKLVGDSMVLCLRATSAMRFHTRCNSGQWNSVMAKGMALLLLDKSGFEFLLRPQLHHSPAVWS